MGKVNVKRYCTDVSQFLRWQTVKNTKQRDLHCLWHLQINYYSVWLSHRQQKKVNCHPKPKTNRLPLVIQGACLCVFYKFNPNCCGDASEDPHDSTETPVDLAHTFKTAVPSIFYSIFLLTVTVHRNTHLKISGFFFFFLILCCWSLLRIIICVRLMFRSWKNAINLARSLYYTWLQVETRGLELTLQTVECSIPRRKKKIIKSPRIQRLKTKIKI